MTRYSVEVTEVAYAALRDYARYIAIDQRAPLNAQRWLKVVLNAIDSLEEAPGRAPLARESAFVPYEVRQLVVGDYLVLFSLDEQKRKVWILDFRHGHRLPQVHDLPSERPADDQQ